MLRHSDFIIKQESHGRGHAENIGMHKLYRYPNNRGASVVFFEYSYGVDDGLWELAPIKFIGDKDDDWEFDGDVVGYLNDKQLDTMLDDIAARPIAGSVGSSVKVDAPAGGNGDVERFPSWMR